MLCPTQTKIYMRQGQLETSLLQYPYILQKVKKCEDVSREAGDQGHRQDVSPRQVHPAQLSGSFTKTMSNGIVANTSSTWEIKSNPLLPGSKRSAVEREGRPSSDRATPAQDSSCFKVRPQLSMSEARAPINCISRERMREESAPLYQTRHHHEEEPRMSTGNPASRLQRQTEEPSAIGMALRSIYRYTGCFFLLVCPKK